MKLIDKLMNLFIFKPFPAEFVKSYTKKDIKLSLVRLHGCADWPESILGGGGWG